MKRKLAALLLALALLLPCLGVCAAAAGPAYTIGNPYASVDWDTWKQYKTQLHVHTNGSDGALPLNEAVEEHYRLGYDILAITDHMTLGVPWNQVPRTMPLMRLVKYERTQLAPMAPLTDARRQEILRGEGRGGRGMLEIIRGIELNGAVPSNSHLQGFFCDFGQGDIGVDQDWETPVKRNAKAGGVTVLNHLGNTTGAENGDERFYDENPRWVDKFAYLFVHYPSLLGMDINSGTDDGTKYDKILYDKILCKTIPYGVVPWSFTYSDAHTEGQFDRAWTVHLMPGAPSEAALRKSMEEGTFFGFSRHARLERNDDAFVGTGAPPAVRRISVDQAAGKIAIEADRYDTIVWVSGGKKIFQGDTLVLADHDADIGSYVRAYLLGPGGILYVQPFTVLRAGQTLPKEEMRRVFDYSDVLRGIVSVLEFLAPQYSPLWLVWRAISYFDPAVDLPGLMELVGYT